MSNDPTGTLGAQRAPVSDLELALAGGEGFVERMRQLSAAKTEADAAVQNLSLGNSVKAAHMEAQRMVATASAESNALKLQAEAALTAGHTLAANIVSEANTNAASIVTNAQARATAIVADANDIKTAAGQKEVQAVALHAQAHEHLLSAAQTKEDVEALAREHSAAIETTRQAQGQAEQTQARLQFHLDKLYGVLREIAG